MIADDPVGTEVELRSIASIWIGVIAPTPGPALASMAAGCERLPLACRKPVSVTTSPVAGGVAAASEK